MKTQDSESLTVLLRSLSSEEAQSSVHAQARLMHHAERHMWKATGQKVNDGNEWLMTMIVLMSSRRQETFPVMLFITLQR